MPEDGRNPRVLAIDAGGTMTDTFIVDDTGGFVVGKAQTTPDDESVGFMRSAEDALTQWGSDPGTEFPRIVSGIYSGTAMLNRLLSRKGRRIGVIVTAGQEDYLKFERGIQTYLGYSYSDRLHIATHHHNEPLVPRDRMKGVRGRIDVMGQEVLPLREEEVRTAAAELLDDEVEGIVVSLLFSYRNAEHEIRVGEILEEAMNGRRVPVYLSSELYPMRRDLPRLNTTLIEAYAAEPSRGTLQKVRDVTKEQGAAFELRAMAAHGGTVSIEATELARTLVSGPIGGVVGRTGAGGADGHRERAVHRHRRHELRHRADHRRAFRDHPHPGHRALRPEHAAGEDRLDRRRHGLVRPHQPELEPAGARARLRGLGHRRLLARGRAGDRLGDRPQRGAGPAERRLLPGR